MLLKEKKNRIVLKKASFYENMSYLVYQILNKDIKRVWKTYGCLFACGEINFAAFALK